MATSTMAQEVPPGTPKARVGMICPPSLEFWADSAKRTPSRFPFPKVDLSLWKAMPKAYASQSTTALPMPGTAPRNTPKRLCRTATFQ